MTPNPERDEALRRLDEWHRMRNDDRERIPSRWQRFQAAMPSAEVFLWVAIVCLLLYSIMSAIVNDALIRKLDERITNIELSRDAK